MEPADQPPKNQTNQSTTALQQKKSQIIMQLLEFGFDQFYVQKAVDITLDKEKAAQIVIKLVQEGPNADLSAFKQPIIGNNFIQGSQIIDKEINIMVEGNQHSKPNRAKMLFIVNGQLKMGKGKICAQVGHGVIGAYLQIEQTAKFDERSRLRLHSWENSGGAKIAVKAKNLQQMLDIKQKLQKLQIGINIHTVEDMGLTQIESGSKTVMAVGPAFSDQIDEITGHLKLL